MQPSRPANFTNARLSIQRRCFGTLAHELGNVMSPLALLADVVETARPAQLSSAAGTLRLVATSLARATTICRFLRGNTDVGMLSPTTIPDASVWWTLCEPFTSDMLSNTAHIRATVTQAVLPMAGYEALTWGTLALARFAAETRPALRTVELSGERSDAGGFSLRLRVAAARAEAVPARARQFLLLASWEARRIGGRVLVADTAATLDCRISLPEVLAPAS